MKAYENLEAVTDFLSFHIGKCNTAEQLEHFPVLIQVYLKDRFPDSYDRDCAEGLLASDLEQRTEDLKKGYVTKLEKIKTAVNENY